MVRLYNYKIRTKVPFMDLIFSKITDVVIPSSIGSVEISNVGKKLFNENKDIINVTISEGITSISDLAFNNCTSLKTVSLPETLNTIGPYSFSGCTALTNIQLPNNLKTIGKYAFEDAGIPFIKIPDSVTYIGDRAFSSEKLKAIDIGAGLKDMEGKPFIGAKYLASIVISENNTKYKVNQNCIYDKEMTELFLVPQGCVPHIIIPDGTKYIQQQAFYSCSKLQMVTIPKSITDLGRYVYGYIYGDPNVFYKVGVCFHYCNSLTKIIFKGTKAQWNAINKDTLWKSNCTNLKTVECTDGNISV